MSPDLDDRDPTGRFVRGLTLGALIGAIIAGSSIWTRARARRSPAEQASEPTGKQAESTTPAKPAANEPG